MSLEKELVQLLERAVELETKSPPGILNLCLSGLYLLVTLLRGFQEFVMGVLDRVVHAFLQCLEYRNARDLGIPYLSRDFPETDAKWKLAVLGVLVVLACPLGLHAIGL